MKIRCLISILAIVLLSPNFSNAQNERKYIRKGNRQYETFFADSTHSDSTLLGKAEDYYRKALEEDPNNWDASYNLANTLLRQNRFDEAARQYQVLASKTDVDKNKRAAAFHNLGNCLLKGNNLQGAVEAYKDALRNNPDDLDTKYNLAWAQDKLKQQQNEQQQNKDQNEQDQKQDQNQDQNQDQQDQNQQNQDQQQNHDQQNQDQQQDAQQQPQEQNDDQQMSKEDAMRILEAMENDEKDVQDKVQKLKAQPQKRRTQKDW